ncbi:MAG: hypothetical protein ACRCZS_12820 [Chroococcidiopsis sp.]
MPRFSISPWQLNRNAIDLQKVRAKIKTAYAAAKTKRGVSGTAYHEKVWEEFEQWLGAPLEYDDIHSHHDAVMALLDQLLDKDQYLEAYTRPIRGMDARLCLRALYVACSRHKETLHFFDAVKSAQ